MSSTGRSPAQRNTNVTALVPVRNGSRYYVSVDPRHCSIFTVDMATLTPSSTSGQVQYYPGGSELTNQHIFDIQMVIDSTIAKYNPGLEFTLFFTNGKNMSNKEKCWIDFFPPNSDDTDILSAPYYDGSASNFLNTNTQSVTLKSDGDAFRMTSTGPSAWTLSSFD
jgi:hypothetical protein